MEENKSVNRREFIQRVIRGEEVERIPVALWRHFPLQDTTAEGLSAETIAFQKKYDWDLVKVTFASGYMAEAFGAQLVPSDAEDGTRTYSSRPVHFPEDWPKLSVPSVHEGILGVQLQAIQRIREGVGWDIPLLPTIFSPMSTLTELREAWRDDLREKPEEVHKGLKIIAQATLNFAKACLYSGADAIFFATKCATAEVSTENEYRTFGIPYDLAVLNPLTTRADFIVLHIHGLNPHFHLFQDYPVQMVNWHDRRTALSLKEAMEIFPGAVMGGLNEWNTLYKGTPEKVQQEVQDAISQTGGKRFLLGPGCVIPIATPEANLQALREAVNRLHS